MFWQKIRLRSAATALCINFLSKNDEVPDVLPSAELSVLLIGKFKCHNNSLAVKIYDIYIVYIVHIIIYIYKVWYIA